jgi:hypothetical protein
MKMKHFFRQIRLTCWSTVLAASSALVFLGCDPATITRTDVSGVYSRQKDGVIDTLVLNTNGDFQQTITYTNGGKWTRSGSWEISNQVVNLGASYSAFDFEHKTIVIPPKAFSMQTLLIEKDSLVVNRYEPIWFKKETH